MTAVVAAAGRAVETSRPDALLRDPFADALVAAADPAGRFPRRLSNNADDNSHPLSDLLGVRSRFIDDVLHEAMKEGVRQVVLVASGLDTRAYRIPWPTDTVVYEIDQQGVLDFKQAILDDLDARETCIRRPLAADLTHGWSERVVEAGFDASAPAVWVTEGLLYYLDPSTLNALLASIDQLSAPGSRWAIEDDPRFLERMSDPEARARTEKMGFDLRPLLAAGTRSDPNIWLRERGWLVETRSLLTVAAQYDRLLGPTTQRINGLFALTNAQKINRVALPDLDAPTSHI